MLPDSAVSKAEQDAASSHVEAGVADGYSFAVEAGLDAPAAPDDEGAVDAFLGVPPSCQGAGDGRSNCGPNGESCCTSPEIPGGSFFRSYDGVSCPGGPAAGVDGVGCYLSISFPATVSAFRLDKYEITVGRFRQFVSAVVAGWRPEAGGGKHVYLNSGQGLSNTGGGSDHEGGWQEAWNVNLLPTAPGWDEVLTQRCGRPTWTSSPMNNESRPVDCETWYAAYAFCIWDGGFLPSEAEWNYAASGGDEQRVYPWSSPAASTAIDCTYANYLANSGPCTSPPGGSPNNVGSESPKGDGKWGHVDMAGNVWEWTLDFASEYASACDDCAYVGLPVPVPASWRIRGGGFVSPSEAVLASAHYASPAEAIGARCARAP